MSDQANGLRVLLIKFEIDEPNSSTEMSLDTTTDNNSSTQSTVENSLGNSLQFTLLSLILMTLVIKFSRKSKI